MFNLIFKYFSDFRSTTFTKISQNLEDLDKLIIKLFEYKVKGKKPTRKVNVCNKILSEANRG